MNYHHQDDVIGFCGDYRHPWGCIDDDELLDVNLSTQGRFRHCDGLKEKSHWASTDKHE